MDIDVSKDLMEKYNVKGFPTWIFLGGDSGKSATNTGLASLEEVLNKIDNYFVD